MNNLLSTNLSNLNVGTNNKQLAQLNNYITILLQWNKAYNLTAAKNYEDLIYRHLLDSVMPHNYINNYGKNLLDVGSGAGFPAIILAILNPHKNITLLDSNGKKIRFLTHIQQNLNLTNVQIMHTRIENFHSNIKFDVIISRAFSNLADFLNLTLNLSYKQTRWITFKSVNYQTELQQISPKFKLQDKIQYQFPTCKLSYILILQKQENIND